MPRKSTKEGRTTSTETILMLCNNSNRYSLPPSDEATCKAKKILNDLRGLPPESACNQFVEDVNGLTEKLK